MKALKALIIGESPLFYENTVSALHRSIACVSPVDGVPSKTFELMCRYQPGLIIINATHAGNDSVRLARTIWSIEPNIRVVFQLNTNQHQLAAELYRWMPADAAAGFILEGSGTEEKMRVAVQTLLHMGLTYIDPALQEPEEHLSSAVA